MQDGGQLLANSDKEIEWLVTCGVAGLEDGDDRWVVKDTENAEVVF